MLRPTANAAAVQTERERPDSLRPITLRPLAGPGPNSASPAAANLPSRCPDHARAVAPAPRGGRRGSGTPEWRLAEPAQLSARSSREVLRSALRMPITVPGSGRSNRGFGTAKTPAPRPGHAAARLQQPCRDPRTVSRSAAMMEALGENLQSTDPQPRRLAHGFMAGSLACGGGARLP